MIEVFLDLSEVWFPEVTPDSFWSKFSKWISKEANDLGVGAFKNMCKNVYKTVSRHGLASRANHALTGALFSSFQVLWCVRLPKQTKVNPSGLKWAPEDRGYGIFALSKLAMWAGPIVMGGVEGKAAPASGKGGGDGFAPSLWFLVLDSKSIKHNPSENVRIA